MCLVGGVFSEAHAQRAVKFFEMLRHTDGQFYNQPFVLLPWQKKIIRDVYGTLKADGTRQYKYVYIEIPKKNGKSELAAGAALYHLFADGEMKGEIYGCAADKGQAGIVYEVARDMIELVPALEKRAKVVDSSKKIIDRVSGSVYRVLSADAFRKHGYKVSACVFDELHAQPNRALWDVMTFEAGASRRQPIWWILTTAGDDPDRVSIGWEEHDYAMKILSGEIIDPTWYVTVFNYEGEDIYNEDNWFAANPSLGEAKSLDSMREAAATAKNKPANERLFRWLDLNQWITTKLSSWLPIDLFDKTVGSWNRADQLGKDCYLGLDLSTTTDLSALAAIFPPQGTQLDWRVFWHCWIPEENMLERIKVDKVPYDKWAAGGWITPTQGNVIDYTVIKDTILEMNKFHKVIELDADRAFATMLIQVLEQEGMVCVDVPQTFVSLTDPLNQTQVLLHGAAKEWDAIAKMAQAEGECVVPIPQAEKLPSALSGAMLMGQMTHENSPVARWCFGNTSIAKNGQGFIKFVKEHKGKSVVRTKRIDLTAAWINGMARARFYKGSVDISAKIMSDDWGM
jgi:phage terminase large subunit-like protein